MADFSDSKNPNWGKEAVDKELQEGDATPLSELVTNLPFYSFWEAWDHKTLSHCLQGFCITLNFIQCALGEMYSWVLSTEEDSDGFLL